MASEREAIQARQHSDTSGVGFDVSSSPSDQVNQVFTSLAQTLERRIGDTNWIDSLPSANKPRTTTEQIPLTNEFKNLVDKFPDIYTYNGKAVRIPFRFSNPVVIQATIGEYGEDWARRTAIAAALLINGAVDVNGLINLDTEAEVENANNTKLLNEYTSRRSGASSLTFDEVEARLNMIMAGDFENIPYTGGSLTTFVEGFQSDLFTSTAFTAKRVPGYEQSPDALLADLVDQNMFSQFSLVVPPAVTALMGKSAGLFVPPVIVPRGNGILGINPIITQHFKVERNGEYREYGTGAAQKLDKKGCPLGRKLPGNDLTGIDMTTRLLSRVVGLQK